MSDEKNETDKPQTWVEKLESDRAAANEKTNKEHGLQLGGIGDESGGTVNNLSEVKKKGEERQGKTFVERLKPQTEPRAPDPQIQKLGEVKEVEVGKKNIHLKSTTALTDPEAARQNLNDASKAKDFGKEAAPPSKGGFRGGSGGRGGSAPTPREPAEILKEKNDVISPEDILSKKATEKPFEIAMKGFPVAVNEPNTPSKKSSFMTTLDAQIDKAVKNQVMKDGQQQTKPEPQQPKQKGVMAEIEKKVAAVKKSGGNKPAQKLPNQEVAQQRPIKPIKRGR